MQLEQYLARRRNRIVVLLGGSGGMPDAPAGFAYLVDSSGAYLVDSDGAYLIGAA